MRREKRGKSKMRRLGLLLALAVCGMAGDCIFELGERAFSECTKMVNEARFNKPHLERGICEVVQDQLEKFLAWRADQLAQELNVSIERGICPRFWMAPYEKQARVGIRGVVELAIERNTRDREVLGKKLEEWASSWLDRATKDTDNSSIEYVHHKDLTKRINEFNTLKYADEDL
jgi:hypothetical protein